MTSARRTSRAAAQVPISDLNPGEPQDLWLDLGKPESRAVRNPLDVGVQARPLPTWEGLGFRTHSDPMSETAALALPSGTCMWACRRALC